MALDAVSAITQDHRVMERLFEECKTNKDNRPALVAEIKARLKAHSVAEEERVYPELAREEPGEADEVYHGIEEHREAEELLLRLETTDPESERFDTALEEFVSAVKHHVEEEENEILPDLEDAVDRGRLEELGAAFEDRRKQLLAASGIDENMTKAELYERAKQADIPGRSSMSKEELSRALRD